MNTPGQNSNAVAELVLGMIVFMNRNKFTAGTGAELKGKRIGIQAYGNIGRLVARIAKGFGMDVWAFDPFVQKEAMQAEGVTVVDNVEDLYAQCAYVSLHIPANESTKKSINYKLLSLLPKGGCVINTARKEVIDEADLLKILEERADIKYATDIAPTNIAELEEKFGTRVFATPKKIGAETAEANINAGLAAANQIVNFLKNGDITFKVN
jgi:D-3-phosphoglycerate dehydrogenase